MSEHEINQRFTELNENFNMLASNVNSLVDEIKKPDDKQKSNSFGFEFIIKLIALVFVPLFVSYQTNSVANEKMRNDISDNTSHIQSLESVMVTKLDVALYNSYISSLNGKIDKKVDKTLFQQHTANSRHNFVTLQKHHQEIDLLIEEN